MSRDLLAPEPTRLPPNPAVEELIARGATPAEIATAVPRDSYGWVELARAALAAGETLPGYAFARTGYHRGLDALRAHGWRGHGPVPASHAPNRPVLAAFAALAQAAAEIGEIDEVERLTALLDDCDPHARAEFGLA